MVSSYTEDLKNHKTVKIGEWSLAQRWALARDKAVLTQSNAPDMSYCNLILISSSGGEQETHHSIEH